MIITAIGFIALLGVIVAALRLNMAVSDAGERLRILTGGYGDAGLLARARQRFRQRQRSIEAVVDSGTAGLATAHGTLSQALGGKRNHGAGVYARLRALNHGVGRALSGFFAPGPRRRSDSLAAWRARHEHRRDEQR